MYSTSYPTESHELTHTSFVSWCHCRLFQCRRAMAAGIPAENISLSTQELPSDFAALIDMGVNVNAW